MLDPGVESKVKHGKTKPMIQSALRRGQPVWLERNHQPNQTRYATLRGHHETDVAIVGGGMTGAMIAALFAEANVKVMVIEAERAGLGSTAASTALLLQEPDYDLTALARKYGPATARRIWQISHDTNREFIDTIHRLRISCRLQLRDSIYYTLNEDEGRALRREWTRRRKAGFDGAWLDAAALHRATGIQGAAAIRTSGNAQLNPLRACHGLLAAAVRMGADVFERSTINRIRRIGDGVRLYSTHGTIDARRAVIATGYATKYFRPLAGRFKMRHTYVLATEPIGWRIRRQLGLGKVMLWDTERPYHYVRWTDDRRLLLGGEDRPVKPGANRSRQFANATRELREYFERFLPPLAGVRIDRAWDGLFATTPDALPFIGPHRRYPGQTFALGYGGNGMTFAALAARILLEQWRGVTSPDHRLFAFNRIR
jgi:glycine/D-amino acid oxidase-like deaminating enzyme